MKSHKGEQNMRLSKLGVVLLALVFAFPLLAQKEGAGLPHKCGAMPELTAEQTAKFQKLALEHQKAMIPLQAELKTKQLDLHQLVMEGADQKKLEAKIDEIAKANADIQKKCLAHRSAALGLLTAEQKKGMPQGCLTMPGGCGMGGHQSGCGMHARSGRGGMSDKAGCGMHAEAGCGGKSCGGMKVHAGKGEKAPGCPSENECSGECGKK